MLKVVVRTYGPEQVDALHAGHVPVGNDEIEIPLLQHGQRSAAIVSFGHIGKTQVLQQILDDASHGREVIDHENFHIFIQNCLR